jgi:hypothetical protein
MVRVLAASLSVIALAGCSSSLMNPHVTWARPPVVTLPDGSIRPVTLADGIAYANNAKDRYKEAVGDQTLLTNALAVGLIPLGAAALGLGVTGGGSTAITALGLAGATAFATGTWLNSKPRQLIYIEGIKAVTCAVDAVLPLSLDPRPLHGAINGVNTAMGDVQQQIGVVRRLIQASRNPRAAEAKRNAEADVVEAEAALRDAATTLAAGVRLDQEIGRAGQALISAVDRIGAEVDRAVLGTVADLQTLPGVIAGLAGLAGQFGGVPLPKRPDIGGPTKTDRADGLTASEIAEVEAIEAARAELATRVNVLNQHSRLLAAIVNSVARPLESLKQCNVAEVATNLTVDPAALDFTAGVDATKRLVISGGKTPYLYEWLDRPTPGLEVQAPVPGGPRLDVVATKPPENSFTLRVSDAAGQSRLVGVKVHQGAISPPPPVAPAQPSLLPSSDADRTTVKAALCVSEKTEFDGPVMRDAIAIYQQTRGAGIPTGALSSEELQDVLGRKPCPKGLKNVFEASLSASRIKNIQTKLKVKDTGTIDDATRKEIRAFKKANKLEDDDQLRPEDAKKIEAG